MYVKYENFQNGDISTTSTTTTTTTTSTTSSSTTTVTWTTITTTTLEGVISGNQLTSETEWMYYTIPSVIVATLIISILIYKYNKNKKYNKKGSEDTNQYKVYTKLYNYMDYFYYINDVMLINTYVILNYFNLSSYQYKDKDDMICLSNCDKHII